MLNYQIFIYLHYIRIFILFLIAITSVLTNPSYSQSTESHVNSGGLSTNKLSFDIGEIFVIDSHNLTEKEKLSSSKFPLLFITAIPNPTENSVIIQSEFELKNKNVHIYDISGRLMLNTNIINSKIDLSALANGTYLIKSSSDEFSSFKIIKQ